MHKVEGKNNSTQRKKEIDKIANTLKDAANLLEVTRNAQFDIETLHDGLENQESDIGTEDRKSVV